jgi:hypothetical protein
MTYIPNFSHPRVINRCRIAIEFVETYLRKNTSRAVASRIIDQHFSNKPLGAFLRKQLLICTRDYYNHEQGICKQYRLNPEGVKYIKSLTGLGDTEIKPDAELILQLESGNFEYENKSNRNFHPLQFKPKIQKLPLLKKYGYRHEYDIQCAAHTLILQHAQHLGLQTPTPAFDQYIEDRTAVRNSLALEIGVDVETVKSIMTSLLQGGYISSWYECSIFEYLNHDINRLYKLKENLYIQQFQRDLRAIWKTIKPSMDLGTVVRSDGVVISRRISSKKKSQLYRELEQSVGVVIQRYLKRTKNKYFFEHDGWSCEKAIDIGQLLREVKNKTGFVIQLDWTIHEYN